MRVFWFVCALSALALGQTPTPLAQLQAEARAHNPQIQAARQRWRAAQAAIAPAGTLPDPQAEVQKMSVHWPAPWPGQAGNMMNYVGIGASQALPYPGKLKLRAAVATDQALTLEQQWQLAGRRVSAQVAEAYIALAQARALERVLHDQQQALEEAEKLAEVRYRTGGKTSQGDVLAVQLEQTELLRDLAANGEEQAAAQAQLRELLNRPPQAPGIIPEALRSTRLALPQAQVLAALQTDPALAAAQTQVNGAQQATALAQKNFKPDFTLQYMYEHTAAGFPDRTMVTLGMSLPFFHRSSRQQPEIEHAVAGHAAAEQELAAVRQQQRYRLEQALLAAQRDRRILTIDQQGALPQARAAAQAELTAYANGAADLNSYLSDWRQELAIETEYWQTLGDHETALATVTELTGVPHD